MSYRLYRTNGVYPNLVKTGPVLWEDTANDTIEFNFAKTFENEEIPGDYLPEAWDDFIQTQSFTINGIIKPSSTESILTQFKKIHKLTFWYLTTSWTEQPVYENIDEPVPFALEIDFPGLNYTTEVLTLYVYIETLKIGLPAGGPQLPYTLTLKSCSSAYVV